MLVLYPVCLEDLLILLRTEQSNVNAAGFERNGGTLDL